MSTRKHTACAGCHSPAACRLLELMWRLDGSGPWTWVHGWTCAACRSGSLQLLADMFGQLTLWDG
jgi:hypothetical protein